MNKINNKIKLFFSDKHNIKKVGIISSIILILALVIIPASFAQTTPIKSVEIPSTTLSYTNNEEGSWNITKSAKWISKGKAEITIKLDTLTKPESEYTDVLLVLDTSGSMDHNRINEVKKDVIELINDTIPKGNKIALITFNDTSSIITDFTNNSSFLKESVNNIVPTGETNYYQALINVDTIMKNYTKEDNRDCVVLFLTDGYPTIDTPNEEGQYQYLKSIYPYLIFNGIQYEMGNIPLENIKKISDNQYIANHGTLNKFLYRASISSANYKALKITDYISNDYYNVSDISTIESTMGNITLENNQLIWDLNGLTSGTEATLTMNVNLNDDLMGIGGTYPISKNLSVSYEIGKTNAKETSALTPILADNYVITYEANNPEDCTASNIPASKNATVFDTVKISTDIIPICEGYKFKEWELVTEDVEKINTDYLIMPEKNITLRATWSKLSSIASMDGEIYVVPTLYRAIAEKAVVDTNVNFTDILSNGVFTMESTQNDEYPVHYYRGYVKNNNLLFANYCWKIVRTTSTGGVKLLYNGEPTEDGQCLSTRENHTGYEEKEILNINYNTYYYGTKYKYDPETSKFQLAGDVATARWDRNPETVIGKYTCMDTSSATATCSTLYQISGYLGPSQAYGFKLNNKTNYAIIGKSAFSEPWSSNSLAYVGYMYDTKYLTSKFESAEQQNVLTRQYTSYSSNYFYGDSITINEDGTYSLDNATQKTWSDNYNALVGYYTCKKTVDEQCSSVYYIAGSEYSYQYTITLSGGKNIDDYKFVIGKEMIDNGDGTYSLGQPETIMLKDWYKNYQNYKGTYTCSDTISTSCNTDIKYISNTSNYTVTYDQTIGYVFGNDVSYDSNTKTYTLIDTYTATEGFSNDYDKISEKYHYTCKSNSSSCQNSVFYITSFGSSSSGITLTNGANIETAKEEMFTNDTSSKDSDLKSLTEAWYQANLKDFEEKIEDTVWCNDRTIYSGSLFGKDYDAGTSYNYFGSYGRLNSTSKPNIDCPKTRDSFTVSSEIGNGLLKYPVGHLTADELLLGGMTMKYNYNNTSYLNASSTWWTMTPGGAYSTAILNAAYYASGKQLYYETLSIDYGVRPSISLIPGLKLGDGSGTEEAPYIIE